MSTNEDPRPLLTLLSLATQRERATLVAALSARGFDDIALPGARLLAALREGDASIQTLADATDTTKQFCAREVQKLATARYVRLATSKEDRRVTLVSLAPRGHDLLEASRATKRELDQTVSKKLGAQNARTLRRLLARLVDDDG
jgi:DNA-binding MarR family transcriptional regulator